MFIPFLGTLLLFNHAVLDALRVPEELLNAWGMNLSLSPKEASLVRLKLTYFGLCSIGIASFMFTLMCPEVVKRYASSAEYVRGDEPLFTGPQVEAATGTIISNFIQGSGETEYGRQPTFKCPQPLLDQTYIFLGEIAVLMLTRQEEEERLHHEKYPESAPKPIDTSNETDEEQAERWEREERYQLWNRHSPGADVDKIVKLIQSGVRAEQGLYYNMNSIGREFPIDAMSLSYLWQNHSRPLVRIAITFIFFLGFSLLSIPTIFTFASVLRQTFQ